MCLQRRLTVALHNECKKTGTCAGFLCPRFSNESAELKTD